MHCGDCQHAFSRRSRRGLSLPFRPQVQSGFGPGAVLSLVHLLPEPRPCIRKRCAPHDAKSCRHRLDVPLAGSLQMRPERGAEGVGCGRRSPMKIQRADWTLSFQDFLQGFAGAPATHMMSRMTEASSPVGLCTVCAFTDLAWKMWAILM